MPLELDSTVLYALHSRAADVSDPADPGHQVAVQHLPAHGPAPGADRQPGNAAIEAALHPAKGDWTYFLTVNPKTGLTKFTNSYPQFQTYVQELNNYLTRTTKLLPHESRGAWLAHRALAVAGAAPGGVPGAGPGRVVLPGDRVRRGAAARVLDGCGPEWAGLSLTMPLKRAVLPMLDAPARWPVRSAPPTRSCSPRPAPWAQHRRARHDHRSGRSRDHRRARPRC